MTYSRFCAWTFALQATTPEGGKFDMGQRKGKVVMRHEGRIAPEAWDSVAELLP